MDELLGESIATSRSLTAELSPQVLHVQGLGPALEWLGAWMRDRHGLMVEVQADGAVRPHVKIAELLFQIVRELLFNVVKHANTYQASLRMHRLEDKVHIVVEDRGAGFDPRASRSDTKNDTGLGLFSIRERLSWLGGELTIDSKPGHGTRVEVLAPMGFSGEDKAQQQGYARDAGENP